MTPAFDDLRVWHGVIFVRKGLFQGGVFKFVVHLPKQYNDHNCYPEVRFISEVFNPFVTPQRARGEDAAGGGIEGGGGGGGGQVEGVARGGRGQVEEPFEGGILDIRSAYPAWDPTTHFMVTVLTFIKKTFYLKEEDVLDYSNPVNPEATRLFLHNPDEFRRRAEALAARSQELVYENPMCSPIAFNPPQPAYGHLEAAIVESDDHTVRNSSSVLDLIGRAKRKTDTGSELPQSFRSIAESILKGLQESSPSTERAEEAPHVLENSPEREGLFVPK